MGWIYTGRGLSAENQSPVDTVGTSVTNLMSVTIPQGARSILGIRVIRVRCGGIEIGSGITKRAWFNFGSQSVFFHPDQINSESWSLSADIEMREGAVHRAVWEGRSGTITGGSNIFTDNIAIAPITMKITAQVDDISAVIRQTVFTAEMM